MKIIKFLQDNRGAFFWIAIIGCLLFINYGKKPKSKEAKKVKSKYDIIIDSNSERENVVLLSLKHNISIQTMAGILNDYDKMIFGDNPNEVLPIEQAIDKIQASYGVEKERIADIIISKRYLENTLCVDFEYYENYYDENYEESDRGDYDPY